MSSTWIQTRSGRKLDFVDPQPDMIHIDDIAEGLAKECRYNGQCRGLYSVAQHSEYCSYLVPEAFAMEALLHDASEAYCKDITRPHKDLMPEYRVIEKRVDAAIREKFRLPRDHSDIIKVADNIMLVTERRDIMTETDDSWGEWSGDVPEASFTVRPYWHWRWTYFKFMRRYQQLEGARCYHNGF